MTLPDPAPKLPTLPEIVQNRTGADISPLPPSVIPPIPCPATPVPPAPSASLLSTRQLNAIPLILAGLTDEQVAAQVGVQRQAVNRWRNQHPRFIAELNRQRQLFHADTVDRYHRLLNQSMAVIERFQQRRTHACFLEEQVKLACTLLRSASRRTLTATLPAPTNPADILNLLAAQGLPPAPEDSPADDAPPAHP